MDLESVGKFSHLTFSLSREELFVLLRLLKAEGIPGVDFSDLRTDPHGQRPEPVTSMLNSAVRALVAREYIIPLQTDTKELLTLASSPEVWRQRWTVVKVRPEVLAVVAACAFPAKSLQLVWRKTAGPGMLYVHKRQDLFIMSTNPLPTVYTFTAHADWKTVLQMIEDTLEIGQQQSASSSPPATMRAEALADVRDELHYPEAGNLLFWLTQGGLPTSTASTFLEALMQAKVVAGFTVFTENRESSPRLTLVATVNTCIVLDVQDAEGELLLVHQMSAQQVHERLALLFKRALEEL